MIGPDDLANNLSNCPPYIITLREKNKCARTNNALGRWKPDEASIEHGLDTVVKVIVVCHREARDLVRATLLVCKNHTADWWMKRKG